jgi:hypothetical protein
VLNHLTVPLDLAVSCGKTQPSCYAYIAAAVRPAVSPREMAPP